MTLRDLRVQTFKERKEGRLTKLPATFYKRLQILEMQIRKIVDDIKKLVMSPKYSGDIEWGDKYHIGRSHKHINLNLRIDKEDEEM